MVEGTSRSLLTRLITVLATIAIASLVAGGALLVTSVTSASGAAPTLTLTIVSSQSGTCENSNPTAPVCIGLAANDRMNIEVNGFTSDSASSITECNSDPSQPVLFDVSDDIDIPVSCIPAEAVGNPGGGQFEFGYTVVGGTTGPPLPEVTPTCTRVWPSTTVIAGCSTTANAALDAADFPCPPTSAQQAAGDACVLTITDQAGDEATGLILFSGETEEPTTSTPTTGLTTTTTGATTAPTTVPFTEGPTTTEPFTDLTGPYELYCPGTPVGNLVLNDVITTATINPTSPVVGQSFEVGGYQTSLNLPSGVATAFASISPQFSGTWTTQLDLSGATTATRPVGPDPFDVTIPSPVPAAGVTLNVPFTPVGYGLLTADSTQITVQEDSLVYLALEVEGQPLVIQCTSYPNNSLSSGISASQPTAGYIAPVIAISGGVPPPTTTTTEEPTTTTEEPTTTTEEPTTTTTEEPITTTAPTTTIAPTTTGPTTTIAPPNTLVPSSGSAPIEPGSTVTVSGSGFEPGEIVDFALFSVQVDLGTAQADSSGNASKTVAIPASFTGGTHTITATGATSGHVDTVTIAVASNASPPSTTASTTTPSPRVAPATTARLRVPAVSSRQLAFTGASSALRWVAFAGALLVGLVGALLLGLAFRRAAILLAAPRASEPTSIGRRAAELGGRRARELRTASDWLLGRRP